MKRFLLFAAIGLQANLFSQALPNGTFENWSSYSYNDPATWNTANARDIQRMGTASITKVTGFSGFGIRIQTNIAAGDTSESYIINTKEPCSDPPQWTGGVPYSQQPTAITGYYRYNLPGNDSALLIVIFRKNGLHIGDNFIKIRGTGSQSTFAPFSFTVNCAGTPDSLIIAAAASNKMSNTNISNGSFIEFDNLAFAGASQPIPNGDFENWTAKSYDQASGWASFNSVSKSTSSYAGTYAIRMETVMEMCGSNANPSGITNGYMTQNNGPKGGQPYTNTIDTLFGYYKYIPAGNDTASAYINLSKNGSPVGGALKKLAPSTNYIFFQVPFSSFTAPDTVRIDFQSSKWPVLISNVGSVLYLDNLYLKSSSLGVYEMRDFVPELVAYPNPVNEVLYIKGLTGVSAEMISIHDALGNRIYSDQLNGNVEGGINVSNFKQGVYIYELKTSEGNIIRTRFIKQ